MELTDILLVDDEERIRDGLKNLLNWEQAGFRILGEAANGVQALALIEDYPPQIVITDLKMPEMDGLELTKAVHRLYPEIRVVILSSYDDFELVSQSFRNGAVDYLLKPTVSPGNLLPLLSKLSAKIKNTQTKDTKSLLAQELNRNLAKYGQDWSQIQEALGSGPYHLLYSQTRWFPKDEQPVKRLGDLLPQLGSPLLPFKLTNGDFGLLLAAQEDTDLQQLLQEVLAAFDHVPQPFFVLGESFVELAQAPAEYQKLKQMVNGQRFYFKSQPLVQAGDLNPLQDGVNFQTKKFIRALLDNDFALGLERIEEFVNQMILAFSNPVFIKQQTSSIFYTLIASLGDAYPKESLYPKLKQQFFQDLNDAVFLEDFSATVLNTLQQIKQALHQASEPATADEQLQAIQRYIYDHYRQPLSLSQVAQHFHFSYNYLSSLFSTSFQMTFTEYVNQVRIEEAKRLLLHSDLNLSEIADACGYTDLSYFSKLFKKHFGSSPSKYRKENRG